MGRFPGFLLAFALGLPGPARPPWVDRLPEAPGRVYALGTADLIPREGQAIARASDRARLEVVARLRATVTGGTTTVHTSRTEHREGEAAAVTGTRTLREEVKVGARVEDLPGLGVEQTYTDAGTGTVYALACLDLSRAVTILGARLARIREGRERVGGETSRRALWRLRRLARDLEGLEDILVLLAPAGAPLVQELTNERTAIDARREALNRANLPPVELGRLAMAVRANVPLPPGVEDFLKAQVAASGLLSRDLDPDLLLSLTFSGGDGGPEFIFPEGPPPVIYRLEAELVLAEPGGAPLTRPVPLLVVQGDSPEGMVAPFRRQVERLLPRLLGEFKAEME